MPDEPISTPSKPSRKAVVPQQSDWKLEAIRASRAVALKLIGTGNAGLLAVVMIVGLLAWRLQPGQLFDLFKMLGSSHLFAVLGWAFFIVTLYLAHRVIRSANRVRVEQLDLLAKEHDSEIQRLHEQHKAELDRLLFARTVEKPPQSVLPSVSSPPSSPSEP